MNRRTACKTPPPRLRHYTELSDIAQSKLLSISRRQRIYLGVPIVATNQLFRRPLPYFTRILMTTIRSVGRLTQAALMLVIVMPSLLQAEEPSAQPLFDGKSLAGWEGNKDVFRVHEGAIVAGTLKAKIAQNEFLATTREYSNFDLRLEAKLVGEGKNAGVQFRSKRIPNHHEVIGYQCDMGQLRDKNIWGWLYDESRRRKFLAESVKPDQVAAKFKDGDWNRLRIRCEGSRIQIWVNDVQTVDYTEKQADIARSGIIALQIHGGAPAEASYRNISITVLP